MSRDDELRAMPIRCELNCGQDNIPLECCKDMLSVVTELLEARELLRDVDHVEFQGDGYPQPKGTVYGDVHAFLYGTEDRAGGEA